MVAEMVKLRRKARLNYDGGMPLEQLQKVLGHQNLQTTLIYAKASLKHVGENYRTALGSRSSSQ